MLVMFAQGKFKKVHKKIPCLMDGNYYSNRRSNQATKKCGRSNASIYASVGATTFFKICVFPFTFEKAPSRPFASARV